MTKQERHKYGQKYYIQHREECQARTKRNYFLRKMEREKNLIKLKEYRDKKNKIQNAYYQKTKKRILAYRRSQYQKNKEEIRTYQRNNFLHVNGKRIKIRKRNYSGYCEICNQRNKFLVYHHWDDNNPAKGIWVCWHCHIVVESIDKGLVNKYISLKKDIEELFNIKEMQASQQMQGGGQNV